MPSSPVNETNHADETTAPAGVMGADEELVVAAKSGDELAFEMLIKRYQSRIFSIAARYARIREDAEDIVQQTFQKAFVYLRKFQGRSSFSSWLTRIAINESLMLLRRGRALREIPMGETTGKEATSGDLEIPDSSPNPEVCYLEREEAYILSSAVAQLTPSLRVVMELRELRELSGPDTARHLGLSISAVKGRVFHGRRKLLKILRRSTSSSRRSGRTILISPVPACRRTA